MGGSQTISSAETPIGAFQIQSSSYGVTVPLVYGVTRIPGNLLWYGDFKAIPHTSVQESGGKGGGGGVRSETTTFTYSASVALALCEGPVGNVATAWKGKQITSAAALGFSVASGALGQGVWPYLASSFPSQALGYSGLSYVYQQDMDLGNSASTENHLFEVQGLYAWQASTSVPDADPADIIADVLTNSRYGAGFPSTQLPAQTNYSNYCRAAGLLLSPGLTAQISAVEFVATLCRLTNAAPVWTPTGLQIVPYGDEALYGNSRSYTPNTTPLYDFTDDDFCPAEGAEPIKITRKLQAEAINHLQLEFRDRANGYNLSIETAEDAASVDAFGRRSKKVDAHWVADRSVARSMVQLLLQREIAVRNTYSFTVPWTRALMAPMDLVTLTDSYLQLAALPVRIIKTTEQGDDFIDVEAEDYPQGSASATLYPSQVGAGFQHNYSAAPGQVETPIFFEAPAERSNTGIEVYAAVRGASANWGGCTVWVAVDDTGYQKKGRVYGGARAGYLTAAMATSGSAAVLITGQGGQLLSGSAADAQALTTLCWAAGVTGVDGGGEYFSYETATLTGANAYTLTGLVRAAFQNTLQAHPLGSAFVRVDEALASSGPLTAEMLGKTLHFKFTSFNIYQAAEQSLAEVAAYTYTVTGAQALLPPPDVASLSIDGDVLSWPALDTAAYQLLGYELRFNYGVNPLWEAAAALHEGVVTESPWALTRRPGGQITLMLRALDRFGAYSRNSVTVITDLGDPPVQNVVEVIDFDALAYPGTVSGGALSGGDLLANSTVAMYSGVGSTPMYSGVGSASMYSAGSWAALVYTTNATLITSALAGSALTLALTSAGDGLQIEYRQIGSAPFYSGLASAPVYSGVGSAPVYATPPDWQPWPGQVAAALASYQWRVSLAAGTVRGRINTLAITIDAPDLVQKINDLAIAIGGSTVPLTLPFTAVKNIAASLQANASGAVGIDINKTNPLAPVARALDASGAAVAGALADFTVSGY